VGMATVDVETEVLSEFDDDRIGEHLDEHDLLDEGDDETEE